MIARPLKYKDRIGIAYRIMQIRTQRNFDQTEFAEIMGVTRVTVNRWENRVLIPHMKKIKLMAFIFKLKPEWILYGEGEKHGNV
ncbi:helix-turn-helix transcriptional regulator [Staphylococcus xylosus]|uniref:helix-turn-helix transcriptional regulator n=1 Tax=Staphylococcus xylosus TaxID=1288 RepID=UPI003F566EC7